MPAFNYDNWNMLDLVPAFTQVPLQTPLLTALNIFEKQGSASVKVAFDRIIEDNKTLLNTPQKRYSYDHDTTSRGEASNYLIELPHFHRKDEVSAKDVQSGQRIPGSTEKETRDHIIAYYLQRHAKAHARTVEEMYARALFRGEVYTPKTSDRLISYTDSFDAPFMTDTIDLAASTTLDVLQVFNGYLDRINAAADGLYSDITRVVVFAGADVWSKLRFHPSIVNAFQYVSPLDSGNIIVQRQEILPNVQTITLPGMSVDVIKVEDKLHTTYLGSNEMVILPIFGAGTNAYQHIYGPASVNSAIAFNGDVQEYFSYLTEDNLGKQDVYYEASILPVNHVTNMTLKITASL